MLATEHDGGTMRTFRRLRHFAGLLVALAVALLSDRARAAEILLDEPVRLKHATCYPSRSDPNRFYYVPTTAHLATQPDGTPIFSFMRWVENVRSQPGEERAREALGGGLVTAQLTLGLTDAQREELRGELARVRPGASLEGAVTFSSGTFALVTALETEKKEFVRQVVGMGEAPIIEGGQAAVSLLLSREGSEILWESFQSKTPAISFQFVMEFDGYRSPNEVLLEADFEEIYNHRSFREQLDATALAELGAAIPVDEAIQAAMLVGGGTPMPLPNLDVGVKARAGGYFSSEIERVFDELRTSGAIRLVVVGSDPQLEKAGEAAYTKLRDMIFAPTERLSNVARGLVKEEEPESEVEGRGADSGACGRKAAKIRARLASLQHATPTAAPPSGGCGGGGKTTEPPKKKQKQKAPAPPPKDTTPIKQLPNPLPPLDPPKDETKQTKPEEKEQPPEKPKPPDEGEKEVKEPETPATPDPIRDALNQVQAEIPGRISGATSNAAPKLTPKDGKCAGYDTGGEQQGLVQLTLAVDVCLTMKYQFKQTRQRGTYRLDMRRFTATTLRSPFSTNIGDLTRFVGNPQFFRTFNLDSPIYEQREITTSLNGIRLEDFGDVLNSVAVQMRKVHGEGEITFDEAVIDRAAFAKRGSDFRLLYGWNGDADRERWNDYEFRALWSFAGGNTLETDWTAGRFGVINLDPPYRRVGLELEADAETMSEREVRLITVRIYYTLGGAERVKQVTLRPEKGELSRKVEILSADETPTYEYEITWRLRGNRSLKSERLTTSESVLLVDELPQ
jgi:hypothetical protein